MANDSILTLFVFTYNQKDTLGRCIESILSQKTQYKYEIHILDDCSTDGTSDIAREYAQKYPDKIKAFIQEENTFKKDLHERHDYLAFKRLKTKYWCSIEGDDYYCDDSRIETGITALIEHPECKMFMHNTIWEDHVKNENRLVVPEEILDGIYTSFYDPPHYTHSSARIYLSDPKLLENDIMGDAPWFYWYKSIAPFIYCSKVMSVYNYSGTGIWSGLSNKQQKALNDMIWFRMWQYSEYKNEKLWFSMLPLRTKIIIKILKLFFGEYLAWHIWFFCRFVPVFGRDVMDRKWSHIKLLK